MKPNQKHLALLFVLRSIGFHLQSHVGTFLGIVVATAVLTGALLVGDCVRGSLRDTQEARLGQVDFAISTQDRYFRDSLASALSNSTVRTASALFLQGIAANNDSTARANHVQILGVDSNFWSLAKTPPHLEAFSKTNREVACINGALARQLHMKEGDTILVRVPKPSFLSADNPLAPREEVSFSFRLQVTGVLTDEQFGRFSLQANQVPPKNLFIPLPVLQQKLGLAAKANLLLASGGTSTNLTAELKRQFRLADLETRLRRSEGGWEMVSDRVYLDTPVVDAARKKAPDARLISTYFINDLRHGTNATPYSMVTAMGAPIVPSAMGTNEILINQWLADDLHSSPGDGMDLTWLVLNEKRHLEERHARFRVRAIVPLAGAAADRTLMPDFPGLAKAEKTEDWDAGVELNMKRIRPKDEQYWKEHRGTPKAFVTLETGKRMWGDSFGYYTAVRFASGTREGIENGILEQMTPSDAGLVVQPVREQAIAAATQSEDFGGLFIGFSFFLIVAALILLTLLFQFSLEKRATETGILLAVGLHPKEVRRLMLLEGMIIAVLGGTVGALAGLGYAAAILHGLSTLWSKAVAESPLAFHVTAFTLFSGAVSGVILCAVTIWLALQRQTRRPARELLEQGAEMESVPAPGKRKWAGWVALASGVTALGLVGRALVKHDTANAELFFASGALLLVSGIALAKTLLRSRFAFSSRFDLTTFALRNCSRRSKRSLSTMALLASGTFLIVAIGVNKLDATHNALLRSSGTGGFALMGESSLSVVQDLNAKAGRDFFGLGKLPGVEFVPMRVHDGDDASCLNLNRAQTPRLLGVDPVQLQSRNAFTFVETLVKTNAPWLLLKGSGNEVPAILDNDSAIWALGKKVGDTLDYTDGRGHSFKVKLVGTIASSILQGSLLIDDAAFVQRYPEESGQRFFLIDAPASSSAQVSSALTRALEDRGLEIISTVQRLDALNTVQNTYLDTFQVLGGLGLLLGTAGLGAVVLRNLLERRAEWAILRASGFKPVTLVRLAVLEHGILLTAGLALGIATALVAILPVLLSSHSQTSWSTISWTLILVYVGGFLWTWLAARSAMAGSPIDALRRE